MQSIFSPADFGESRFPEGSGDQRTSAATDKLGLYETGGKRGVGNGDPITPGPTNTPPKSASPSHGTVDRRGPRVAKSRILLSLNQLAMMSQNGIEIADALESVAVQCKDDRLAEVFAKIHESVNAGQTFSAAIATHGYCFPASIAPMLAAAEASGDVPETLRKVCVRMREEMQLRGSIVGALIYPAILVGASSFVILALILGVLPQFGKVFESLGKPVPVYTQCLLDLGTGMRAHWMVLLPLVITLMVTSFLLRRHPLIWGLVSKFLMYFPVLRNAYQPLAAGRNLRTFAAMVSGGVPMLQAVQLSGQTVTDPYWRDLLRRMEERLIDGLPASSAMVGVDFIPPETHQLMMTAEKTGRIAEVLEDIGAFYEEEAARRMKQIVTALEPMIILVMGVLVGGIVMAVMLPMLDITTTSR